MTKKLNLKRPINQAPARTRQRKPPTCRPKDRLAIEQWAVTGDLVEAYKAHIAVNKDSQFLRQNAFEWSRKPHIRAALDEIREAALASTYGTVADLITAQLEKFEHLYREGLILRPDVSGVMRPESLATSLGAVMGITKLFAAGVTINATRVSMARTWNTIRKELGLSKEESSAVERAITRGLGI